ncbi:MAG: glycoside hydrolase [Acidobacteria bacterium]|nr:glycoside hydrolase [Acidobacteriota bacterium]
MRLVTAAVAVVIAALLAAGSGGTLGDSLPLDARAVRDARTFLDAYERRDGRVVRTDQGGDTVSEGQGYALLAAVAIGDRGRFASAWRWSAAHLARADGLLSWHWKDGRVLDPESATDADLAVAWALTLADRRFGIPAYGAAAARLGAAIVAGESTNRPHGPVLVAGPWARAAPPVVNPSYLAPQAAAVLPGPVVAADRVAILGLVASGRLPSDWANLDADGGLVRASGDRGRFGLDAQRLPVLLAASCDARDVAAAARLWPAVARLDDDGAALAYEADGTRASPYTSPLGLVAAAATAGAAGDKSAARALLDAADQLAGTRPTYYGAAWAALGRLLLTTRRLATCPVL